MELFVGVWGSKGGEHEVVWVLEIRVETIWLRRSGRGIGIGVCDDSELDNRGWINGATVSWREKTGLGDGISAVIDLGRTFSTHSAHARLESGRGVRIEGRYAGDMNTYLLRLLPDGELVLPVDSHKGGQWQRYGCWGTRKERSS